MKEIEALKQKEGYTEEKVLPLANFVNNGIEVKTI